MTGANTVFDEIFHLLTPERLLKLACLADMLDVGDRLKQQLQPLQRQRLVVDGQDPKQAHATSSGSSIRTWKLPSASRFAESVVRPSP